MTEKRFTYRYNSDDDGSEFEIIDLDKDEYYPMGETDENVVKALGSVLNEFHEENEQLKQQLNRLYNYFEDWYSDMTSANDFSEIWDNVKEDERWGDVE